MGEERERWSGRGEGWGLERERRRATEGRRRDELRRRMWGGEGGREREQEKRTACPRPRSLPLCLKSSLPLSHHHDTVAVISRHRETVTCVRGGKLRTCRQSCPQAEMQCASSMATS